MNSVAYLPQSKRLLEQVSEVLRYKHYSLKTEQAYLYWVRFFVRWHGRDGQMQHPRSMGGAEVTQFLTMLANERRVSVSTHNQALSALLFLYREVLAINLPWLTEVQRPIRARRIPSVLTKAEVASLLGAMDGEMDGEMALLAKLLYGTGMRLMEGLRLRVKDVDFDRQVLVVREAKGGKDRVVMLPRTLHEVLKAQVLRARAVWTHDREVGSAGVEVPDALGRSSTRTWVGAGAGFGCFLHLNSQLTHAPGLSAGITYTKNACNVPSSWPVQRRKLSSRCRFTLCAIHSPHICCKVALTFVPCKNCWVIAMSAPP